MFDFLNSRIKDLFSDFIDKMNSKDEKLFIEGLNKRIEIRKMF
jgi:UDP-2,3-diacylglucosamine pyrophosphatase LpxH